VSLKLQIQNTVKDAMRAREKERLGVLRLITAAIKQREVDERMELDDEQVLAVLNKMLKQRRESISQYEAANRKDLATVEKNEIEIIQAFLPEQLSADDVQKLVLETITQTGASSMKDMGKLMGVLQAKIAGRADMSAVSALVKKALSA